MWAVFLSQCQKNPLKGNHLHWRGCIRYQTESTATNKLTFSVHGNYGMEIVATCGQGQGHKKKEIAGRNHRPRVREIMVGLLQQNISDEQMPQ